MPHASRPRHHLPRGPAIAWRLLTSLDLAALAPNLVAGTFRIPVQE